ncbi:MAG: STAS domain-containing protein [Pseudanabaena sp. CRU_2_10]|nr:STAS domain-containing protein [Pseudanabaena sp. CRU_2_10]
MTTFTATAPTISLTAFKSGTALVLRPDAARLDLEVAEQLLQRVESYFSANQLMNREQDVTVLVDLQNVAFLDSKGLGALLSALKIASAHNGKLFLCSLQESVRLLCEITKMDRVFTIFEDCESFSQYSANMLEGDLRDRPLITL